MEDVEEALEDERLVNKLKKQEGEEQSTAEHRAIVNCHSFMAQTGGFLHASQ